jgi:hypothetical protein
MKHTGGGGNLPTRFPHHVFISSMYRKKPEIKTISVYVQQDEHILPWTTLKSINWPKNILNAFHCSVIITRQRHTLQCYLVQTVINLRSNATTYTEQRNHIHQQLTNRARRLEGKKNKIYGMGLEMSAPRTQKEFSKPLCLVYVSIPRRPIQ